MREIITLISQIKLRSNSGSLSDADQEFIDLTADFKLGHLQKKTG